MTASGCSIAMASTAVGQDPRILGRPVPDPDSVLKSGSADIRGYPHVSTSYTLDVTLLC